MNGQQVRDDLVSARLDAPVGFALPEIAFPDVALEVPEPASGDPSALITAILAGLETQHALIPGTFAPDDAAGPAEGAGSAADGLHSDDLRDSVAVATAPVAPF